MDLIFALVAFGFAYMAGSLFIKVKQLQSGAIAAVAVPSRNRMVITMAVYCYAATIFAVAVLTSSTYFVLDGFYTFVIAAVTFVVFNAVRRQR